MSINWRGFINLRLSPSDTLSFRKTLFRHYTFSFKIPNRLNFKTTYKNIFTFYTKNRSKRFVHDLGDCLSRSTEDCSAVTKDAFTNQVANLTLQIQYACDNMYTFPGKLRIKSPWNIVGILGHLMCHYRTVLDNLIVDCFNIIYK